MVLLPLLKPKFPVNASTFNAGLIEIATFEITDMTWLTGEMYGNDLDDDDEVN